MNTMSALVRRSLVIAVALASRTGVCGAETPALPETIARIKPAIVAVGTFQKTRRPPAVFRGTGFVVGNGLYVATNAHVLPAQTDGEKKEVLAVFAGKGEAPEVREVTKVAEDRDHDLALLRLSGRPLTPMLLGDSNSVREGEIYAFTGYPIGMVLGLYPVTHRSMISTIAPIAIPQLSGRTLDKKLVTRLSAPYKVFQLDATAYPGNSGSPLFDPATGEVIGILNKVFIQESRENVLQKPSGISYAIPVNHLRDLLKKSGIEP